MAPCPKLKLAYAVGSLRLLKIKTPSRAKLRPRRRLSFCCAVDCAGGELWNIPTPVPCLRLLVELEYPSRGKGCQLLLPRCYQNTQYQEHLGAPSVTANPRVFVRIGPRRVCHYCAKTIERGGRPAEEDRTLEERQPPGNSGISLGGVR